MKNVMNFCLGWSERLGLRFLQCSRLENPPMAGLFLQVFRFPVMSCCYLHFNFNRNSYFDCFCYDVLKFGSNHQLVDIQETLGPSGLLYIIVSGFFAKKMKTEFIWICIGSVYGSRSKQWNSAVTLAILV